MDTSAADLCEYCANSRSDLLKDKKRTDAGNISSSYFMRRGFLFFTKEGILHDKNSCESSI